MREKVDLCKLLIESVKDEGVASIDYGKMADRLRESTIPEVKNLSILFEKIAQDEASHKVAVEKVVRLVCPVK